MTFAGVLALAAALHGAEPSIVAEIRALQSTHAVPAVGLVIVRSPDEVHTAAWGRTGDPTAPDADVDTVFRLGSITKSFTALALAAAAEQRGVSLDAPLDEIVGAGSHDNPFPGSPVRLRHLVEHTAGLGDLTAVEFDYADPKPLTLAEALALDARSRRVQWPPGTRSSYTNVGPGLSALAVERLTGEPFETFATRAVLRPLGLSQASFYPVPGMAHGFKAGGAEEIPYWNMTFRAYGALNASVAEMASFVRSMLDGGTRAGTRIVSERTFADLRRPRTTLAAAAGLEIGYGLGMYGWIGSGHVFWGHGGDADGYRSRYGLLPAAGRGYFVVINADDPATLVRMQRALEAHLVSDLPSTSPPSFTPAAAELDRWTGEYYPSSARFRIDDWRAGHLPHVTIARDGARLVFRNEHRTVRLLPVAPHLFRRQHDPLASIAFIDVPRNGSDTCTHLQGELGNFVRLGAAPRAWRDLSSSARAWRERPEDSQMRCIRE